MSATETATLLITTSSPQQTEQLGRMISRYCSRGDCIALSGDLGAGKTVFSRGVIREKISADTEVTSPTFTLVQTYDVKGAPPIWHFDLYRLDEGHELLETGLEEALEHGMTLIEWPKLAQDWLPEKTLKVFMNYGEDDSQRQIRLEGQAVHWADCFNEIKRTYQK